MMKSGVIAVLFAALLTAPAWAQQSAHRVVVVKMIGQGETFRFEPSRVEVQHGDVVRFVHTGEMLHNVRFVEGRIPAGADLRDYLISPFLPDHGTIYDLHIDTRFLVGSYTFICIPHEPWDMRGELVVIDTKPKG